jgi:hypothetical protein
MSMLIQQLEQQLAQLKATAAAAQAIPTALARPDIQAMIAAEVSKTSVPSAQPSAVPNETAVMMALLGSAFTEDQQMWISANVKSLPAFIVSDAGKASLNKLLYEFQSFMTPK